MCACISLNDTFMTELLLITIHVKKKLGMPRKIFRLRAALHAAHPFFEERNRIKPDYTSIETRNWHSNIGTQIQDILIH
jgi:hypothetical protein